MPIHFSIFLRSFHSLLWISFLSGSFLSFFRSLIFCSCHNCRKLRARHTQNRAAAAEAEQQPNIHHITSQPGKRLRRRRWRLRAQCREVRERFYLSISIASLMAQCDIPIRKCCQFTRRYCHSFAFIRSLIHSFCVLPTPEFPESNIESRQVHMCCMHLRMMCAGACMRIFTIPYIRSNHKGNNTEKESGVSLYWVKLQDLQHFDKITMWHWCVSFALNCHLIQYFTSTIYIQYNTDSYSTYISLCIVIIFYFIVVVCLLVYSVTLLSSIYFTLSLLALFSILSSHCCCCRCHFPYIQWSRRHTIKKLRTTREKESKGIAHIYTRPLEHQLRFWHATLINLRIIETQRHLLMYFGCAALCVYLCLLCISARAFCSKTFINEG